MVKIQNLLNLKEPLILASQSPRRKKLLEQLGFEFTIQPSDVDESEHILETTPEDFVIKLSFSKAKDVASRQNEHAYILGADTIVVLAHEILTKPVDKADAKRILRTLSGRTHKVFTGITIMESITYRSISAVQVTDVIFRELEDKEIEAYIATGSPFDKAGAYGIQDDFGAVFISHINGCYYNIVGLPLELLYSTLKQFSKEQL